MGIADEKQKILIVDDDPASIKVLKELLPPGNEVLAAANGEEALKIAGSAQPDLILLDIRMPGMDGYEVCARLKADARTRDIMVVFVTIMDDQEDEIKGLELGAIDYIRKPISPAVVRARLKNHLELKRSRDTLKNLFYVDVLTRIPNRSRFEEVVEVEWRRAARDSTWLSLVLMDIDQFSAFNEHYGKAAGDNCLQMVAQALSGSLRRASDFVARYGEDEFAALLPGTDARSAAEMGEILCDGVLDLAIDHSASTSADYVTVSMATVSIIPVLETPHVMLAEAAEKTLLEAKQAGGGQVRSTVL